MVALSRTSLAGLPQRVQRPSYDRGQVRAGIAHFSVGNFHRAHQAVYLDRCLALPGQEGWGICGVGLIDNAAERAKARGMAEQDGLYTLSLFPPRGEPTSSVVGAIVEYLFAPANPAAVLARLRDPAIRIVSMTIPRAATTSRRAPARSASTRPTSPTTSPTPKRPGPYSASSSRRWPGDGKAGCRRSPCCPATISSTMAMSPGRLYWRSPALAAPSSPGGSRPA